MMTEAERMKLLDEASVRLVEGYQARGCMAFLVRNDQEGNISTIGPALPCDTVRRFLVLGADTYERRLADHDFGPFN